MTTRVEGIHPLSPLQQGLLYHTVRDPGTSFYVDQIIQRIDGDLDTDVLHQAWQRTVDRHTILRTSFHWEGIDEPAQVVHADGMAPLERHDWRGADGSAVTPEAADERLEYFLRSDRSQGFRLDHPPLLRLHLVRVAEREHIFVLRYHHILLDAWSALLLLEEALTSYDHLASGDQLPAQRVRPYHDYVTYLRGQDPDLAQQFWRSELAGFRPAPLALAASPALPEHGFHDRENPEVSRVLSHGTGDILRRLARDHRITLSTVLQTAWGLVLSRYTGQRDTVYGMTMTHRPSDLDGIEDTPGLFINTLPLRIRLDPHRPFADACTDLQAAQARVRGHLGSALADVQQWSDAAPGEPLFDSIMTILNVPRIDSLGHRSGALTVRRGEYRYHTNYPLSVLVVPDEDITLRIGYDRQRLSAADAERLLGHFATVLETVAADFTRPAGEISLLTDEERQAIEVWGRGPFVQPPAVCLHQLFEEQARRSPDAPALSYGERTLTYSQLDARANQLARFLKERGVGVESRVGLCLMRSVDLVVALIGVLKAGGTFVPLDPAYPQDRLDFMSQDAGLSLLLTDEAAHQRLSGLTVPAWQVQEARSAIDEYSTAPVACDADPGSLAYVIYTSGSTGRPKGALVTHAGAVNSCIAQREVFGAGPQDRVLQWASPSFDASVFEIFLALGAGAVLCLAAQEDLLPGPALVDLLARERITWLVMAPSALAALPDQAPEQLPELRGIVLGGESVSTELTARWCPGRRLFNVYGHTETSIWATVQECAADGRQPSVGRPIPGVRLHLLDSGGQPVPIGLPGELCLGGIAVGSGYLNRPALTAERFPADPYCELPGSRLYRSGDLLRWLPDGRLEFVGRADGQTKLRGLRIETGEIESTLREHPAVKDAVVQVRTGAAAGDQLLVAYLVTAPGTDDRDVNWRDFLREKLPDYMVPNAFVTLPFLPLTANGKLDHTLLPAPERAAPATPTHERSTPLEQRIADLWAQVLGLEIVGPHEDFFALGGNSIKATRIASRIRQDWQADLSIRTVMENPTVAGCAAALDQILQKGTHEELG